MSGAESGIVSTNQKRGIASLKPGFINLQLFSVEHFLFRFTTEEVRMGFKTISIWLFFLNESREGVYILGNEFLNVTVRNAVCI